MWPCDQSLLAVAFLWEKLSKPQFYKDLAKKTIFFEVWSRFKFNNLGLALGMALNIYTSVGKGLKLKVRKFWELIHAFVEVTGEKLVEGVFAPPPRAPSILNRVKPTSLKKFEIQLEGQGEIFHYLWIQPKSYFSLWSNNLS